MAILGKERTIPPDIDAAASRSEEGEAATACSGAVTPDLSLDRLRDFAEAAGDWFWETDTDAHVIALTDRLGSATAGFGDGAIGLRFDKATLLDTGDWSLFIELLHSRRPFRDIRLRFGTPQGGQRHCALSGVPVADEAGIVRGYRGVARDHTLLARAEERALRAQNRLVDAIEAISEGFLLLDADDRLVLCNERYRAVHPALAPVLVPGGALADIRRAARKLGMVLPEARRNGGPYRRSAPSSCAEHRLGDHWVRVSKGPTRDGGTVVIRSDITAMKRREQELAEKTDLLRSTLDHIEQGLMVVDESGTIIVVNQRYCTLYGDVTTPAELTGLQVAESTRLFYERLGYGAAEIDALVVQRIDHFRTGLPAVEEMTTAHGQILERRIRILPDGSRFLTVLDITARKRAERALICAKEEAELASRSKTEFLANMSHELRTPLNAIIGFGDILIRQIFGPLGDPHYLDYARDIHDSGRHLLEVINDVLDISKVEFGKVELIEEPVDIGSLIDASVRLMRDRAESAGLRFTRAVSEEALPFLLGDGRRLKQVLINLISNAIKFTPKGGHIAISVTSDEDGLRMVVEDSGIGIAPHDMATALRPFGQIDSRLSRAHEGTGLGLPLCRSMVELHGGRLELDSTPGTGTKATVWLPAARLIWRGLDVRHVVTKS
jgi:signal transduction histidine kinase